MRTIWLEPDGATVGIIDQTLLPFELKTRRLGTLDEAAHAIRAMLVRGAPLIGATAAYGMALAMRADRVRRRARRGMPRRCWRPGRPRSICAGRSRRCGALLQPLPRGAARRRRLCPRRRRSARRTSPSTAPSAGTACRSSKRRGSSKGRQGPVEILTHCNAGWLAAVDWGTALAPIYLAHDRGIPIHVWVDETRPRNQGASLTAWELGSTACRTPSSPTMPAAT